MISKSLQSFRSSSRHIDSDGNDRSATMASEEAKKNGKGLKLTVLDTSETNPIIHVEKTAKKSSKLEPGDIILASSIKVPGVMPTAVRRGSTATQGGLNHAAIYVGDNKIVEGRIGRGVKELSLLKGTRKLNYTVVRPNLSKKVRQKAAVIAKRQIGKGYSGGDLVQTGAYLGLLPDSLRERVLSSSPKEDIDDKNSMQCAALVAGSYAKAGKNLTNLDYRYVAPVDLLSKTDSTIIKMKKRKGDPVQGTPFTITASAAKAKKKLKQFMEKRGSFGNLSLFCHVDATDWCPHGDIIERLSPLFTKEVKVEIYPRHLVSKVWSQDHCDKPYEKDYYAFRAYAGCDYCKIFVDETETKDSVLWVMLHELAHIALASSPFLFKAYRHLTPPDYFESDEAHESDPEEQMANCMALSWMDMLGYGKVNYPRHWWRQRTIMNKHASVAGGALLGGGLAGISGFQKALDEKRQEDLEYLKGNLTSNQLKQLQNERIKTLGLRTALGASAGGLAGGILRKGLRSAEDAASRSARKFEEAGSRLIDQSRDALGDAADRSARSFKEQSVEGGKEVADYADELMGNRMDTQRKQLVDDAHSFWDRMPRIVGGKGKKGRTKTAGYQQLRNYAAAIGDYNE